MIMSQSTHDLEVINTLQKVGFISPVKLTHTLQGSIWRASQDINDSHTTVIIKVTNRSLHSHQISYFDGVKYFVHEDILTEKAILEHVTKQYDCPTTVTKFQAFFQTQNDFYLVEEDGGSSVFDFIVKAHNMMKSGAIELNHWKKVVKIIFKQMVNSVEYLHSKCICHCDVSLENFVINDVTILVEKRHKAETIKFTSDIQIKLCDFGLAKIFGTKECLSSRNVGKTIYKSPEVISKKGNYSARKNDTWGLGVCLFMITAGVAPWHRADDKDNAFQMVKKGLLSDLLKGWNLLSLFDLETINLLQSIFKNENERISLNEIKQHSWFKSL